MGWLVVVRQALFRVNATLALAFAALLLTLLVKPELAEQPVLAQVQAIATQRALEKVPASLRTEAQALLPKVRATLWNHRAELAGLPGAELVQREYAEVLARLRRDLTIFAVSNLVLFVLAALAARRDGPGWRMPVLSAILLLSAVLGSYCYVWGQDWLETVLFSRYFGYGYSLLVGCVAALLSDIAFNRGRVTRALVETLVQALAPPS